MDAPCSKCVLIFCARLNLVADCNSSIGDHDCNTPSEKITQCYTVNLSKECLIPSMSVLINAHLSQSQDFHLYAGVRICFLRHLDKDAIFY